MRRNAIRGIVLATVLLPTVAACSWPTLGHDAARTGNNVLERTLTLANVAQLGEAWSADAPGTTPPVVVGDSVYVAGPNLRVYSANGTTGCAGTPVVCVPAWSSTESVVGSPTVAGDFVFVSSTTGSLSAYDAHGVAGCGGTPKVCTPRWTASIGSGSVAAGSPAVDGGVVYVGGDKLYAFDAAGTTGCSGAPKVCLPLWTASTAGMSTAGATPSIANGVVYAVSGSAMGAYDAHGVAGCSGTPKVCTPRWVLDVGPDGPDSCFTCSLVGPPTVAGGRAYVLELLCCSGGRSEVHLLELDAAGTMGCSGAPKVCLPLAAVTTDHDLGLRAGRTPLAAGGDRVHLGDADLQVFARDGLTPVWRSSESQGIAASSPSVANGVVYALAIQQVGTSSQWVVRPVAYDASGQSHCAGTPLRCDPVWTGPSGPPTDVLGALDRAVAAPTVVDGTVFTRADRLRVYRLGSAPGA